MKNTQRNQRTRGKQHRRDEVIENGNRNNKENTKRDNLGCGKQKKKRKKKGKKKSGVTDASISNRLQEIEERISGAEDNM